MAASDSDGEFLHFKWIMGTGHEFFSSSEFVFTYWYAGKYPVTVIAYDDKWGTDTISDTVIVTGDNGNKPILTAYPVPAFTFQEVYFKLENAPEECGMPSTIGISPEEDPQWARFQCIPLSVGRRI